MTSPVPRWFTRLGLLALAAYAVFLGLNMASVAAGPDSSGYFNSAQLLASGKLTTPFRVPAEFGGPANVNPVHFMPFGFRLASSKTDLAPTYPTGLPLHFAATAPVLGWHAGPFGVQLAAAIGAVWLMYLAARQLGLGGPLAATGAATLALFPVFLFTSIQTLSDTLATTWTLAALYAGLRARQSPRWAIGCGVAFAIAVLVRPTNLLLAPALVVLLGWHGKKLLLFLLGGLPGAAWLAWYNTVLYGSPFSSGYINSFQGFATAYGAPTALHFAKWLAAMLPAVVLLTPVVALFRRDTRGREFVALALAAGANIGVYLFYDVSRDVWWCLRFILPGVAPLILAGLLGLESLARGPAARWARGFRATTAVVLIVWAAAASWFWTRALHVMYVPGYERAYDEAAQLVRRHVPAEALVVCSPFSGSLYFYTGLPVLVYDHVTVEEFGRYAELSRRAGRPVYALLFKEEREDALNNHCPGEWSEVGTVRNIDLLRLQSTP